METRSYNFSSIHLLDLQNIVAIDMGTDEAHGHKFDEWFKFAYKLKPSEGNFLKNLIKKHVHHLSSYSEEKLKMKFLALIFDKIDFVQGKIQDWYDASLSGVVNGVKLAGFADFMVAKGTAEIPHEPYFFIQEFKSSVPDRNPKYQLLAEMLIAVEKNQVKIMRGGFIIGQFWNFVILEKIEENKFEYFVSEAFDSMKINDLKQIYINLQAVKLKYCVD